MALFSNIVRLRSLDVTGRRVFLRADFDLPFSAYGGVIDDTKLRAVLPTMRHLLAAGAKVVVGSHYGTIENPAAPQALSGVARRLSELLGRQVVELSKNFDREVSLLSKGDVALVPNLVELDQEPANDVEFANRLASSLDVYVNDDLRSARESWTSVDALARALPSRGAGSILGADLDALELLADNSRPRPCLGVVGGDSFARKARLLWSLLLRADALVLGGAVANTCLAAEGWHPGQSTYEPDQLEAARSFLAAARQQGVQVHLPQDVLVLQPAAGLASLDLRPIGAVASNEAVVDIAVETCLAYRDVLRSAGTIVWNGLMGVCSDSDLQSGTYRVAQAITAGAAQTMVFGARTVAMIELLNVVEPFRLVSRSGTAALNLMSGSVLPGVESLRS